MYRKKYGRMTFAAWLNAEMDETSLPMTILGGVLLAAACIAVRWVTGSPHRVILELGIGDLLPPTWVLFLMRLFALFTAGCAFGVVLGNRCSGSVGEKYKGAFWFVLMAVLELCWYPTLLVRGLVLLTVLEAILMTLFAILATISFWRVSRFAGAIQAFHTLWLFYILVLSFTIGFRV